MICVSTTFLPDGSKLNEALKKCEQIGIKNVEIGSNHCYEVNYDYVKHFEFKYLVHNYFPIPKNSFVLNIASFDKNIRSKSIQHIKSAIDFCKKIDAKIYTFHPGFLTDPLGANTSKENYDFNWDNKKLLDANFIDAKILMYKALDEIIEYSKINNIHVAIETEGSVKKKDHLLMQRPDEYKEFIVKYKPCDIGINLNIGHLRLAARSFGFNEYEFADLIQDYIIAMELSHNDGYEDDHLPLKRNEWYWNLIKDPRFQKSYKILEFRNTNIDQIASNINLIKGEIGDF